MRRLAAALSVLAALTTAPRGGVEHRVRQAGHDLSRRLARVWTVHYPSREWVRLGYRGNRIGRPFATGGKGLGLRYDLRRNPPAMSARSAPGLARRGATSPD